MTARDRVDADGTIRYHLRVALRMAAFILILLLFAGLGLVDAGVHLLSPPWRSREDVPGWVSSRVVRLVLRLFPLMLFVPCSLRRQYRVLRLDYPRRLRPGQLARVRLSARNTSSAAWQGGGVHPCRFGVVDPPDKSAFYVAGEWIGPARLAELSDGTEVRPAEEIDLEAPIQAPRTPGRYRETWGILIEGRNWLPTLHAVKVQIEVSQED
jgi:hypothetical protein